MTSEYSYHFGPLKLYFQTCLNATAMTLNSLTSELRYRLKIE